MKPKNEIESALEIICQDARKLGWKYEFEIKDASTTFLLYSKRTESLVDIPIPMMALGHLKGSTEETEYLLIASVYDQAELKSFRAENHPIHILRKNYPLVYKRLNQRWR